MICFEDGEADTANKQVDSRFPGWYYTEDFRYTLATECACVKNNWQVGINFFNQNIFYGPQTRLWEGNVLTVVCPSVCLFTGK